MGGHDALPPDGRHAHPHEGTAPSLLARVAIALIGRYQQTLSPRLGLTCMYEPTCSRYAVMVIRHRGVVRGGWAAAHRLSRCRPQYRGTIDYPEEELHV